MKKKRTSAFGTVSRVNHDSSAFYNKKLYREVKRPLQEKTNQKATQTTGRKTKSQREQIPEQKPPKTNTIYRHDSRNMKHLPDNSVHVMITSPPYNVGKEYDDDLSLADYKNLLSEVMKETHRVLVQGGRACVNIANIGRTPYIPLHTYLIEIAHKLGFYMRGEIIWDKGASAGVSCAWGSWKSASNPVLRDVHEYILVFSKGVFKRHPIKENSLTRDAFIENTKSIWRFSTESAKKVKHPAPFPVELPLRLIHLYSYKDEIVLDPFMGSGTTAVAALQAGRKYIGYEIDQEYVRVARDRISQSTSHLP